MITLECDMNEPDPISFWQGVVESGLIVLVLYLGMIVSFAFAIRFALRRAGSVIAFACSMLPFIFGAFAMWVGVLALVAIAPMIVSGLYDGDPTYAVRLAQ